MNFQYSVLNRKNMFRTIDIDYYTWIKIRRHLKGMHPKKLWKSIIKKYFSKDIHGVSNDK